MKISVVTVSFNCKHVIEETILNVLGQTYLDKEYVIIDGASTDGTLDIIKKHEPGISCIVSEPDKGIFDAMNKSLDYVTGDYVIFMNAGDRFVHCNVLSDIFAGKTYDADLIYGDTYLQTVFGYKLQKAHAIYLQNPTKKDLVFKSQGICHQSILTKVSILRNIKFNLAYPMGADYDTTAQIFYKGNHKLIYVGFPISIFDDRTGGASHGQILRVLKERRIYFNYKSILFYPRAYYRYFIGLIKKILGSLFPLLVNTYRKKKYMSSI